MPFAAHYSPIRLANGLRTGAPSPNRESIFKKLENRIGSPHFALDSGCRLVVCEKCGLAELAETQSSDVTGVVNAFGMFWERSKVKWDPEPKILGSQSGAKPVNFCGQKGVYLLHDSQGVVYVGRTTDQSLGKRLYQHTTDRLTGRWTRFSWFGVFPVESSGELKLDSDFSKVDIDTVIVTMEAVLIEGLEPRQNRKRGDAEFQAIEFLQVEDPKLETNRKLSLIQELAAKLSQG